MQAGGLRPILQGKGRIDPQRRCQRVWPVMRLGLALRHTLDQELQSFDWYLLTRADNCVGIGDRTDRESLPSVRCREDQHLGARSMEAVKVALERPMENHVAGANAMAAGIARFVITAR